MAIRRLCGDHRLIKAFIASQKLAQEVLGITAPKRSLSKAGRKRATLYKGKKR